MTEEEGVARVKITNVQHSLTTKTAAELRFSAAVFA